MEKQLEIKEFAHNKTQELVDLISKIGIDFFAANKDADKKLLRIIWGRAVNYVAIAPYKYNIEYAEKEIESWKNN